MDGPLKNGLSRLNRSMRFPCASRSALMVPYARSQPYEAICMTC